MDQVKEVAEVVTAIFAAVSSAALAGLLLLRLISPFTRTKKDDKLVEKLKDV